MAKNYSIRKISFDDTDRWVEMWNKYMLFYQATVDNEVINHTLEELISNNEDTGCLLACDEKNRPVGFLTYVTHFSTWKLNSVCYLHDLFVEEGHRQSGVAKLLLDHLKLIGDTRHWSKIYWLTKPDNIVAREFYDKIANSEAWIKYGI